MFTKGLAFLALATIANGNDLIVGLKTDGKKIFDENRQANPALWRQMDNVTIKAPENEVIRRVVITDLRPDKDGDVKVVEGGEGQKNITIELKSPTVLRGYEFHIEVYSATDDGSITNDQQSTTEIIQDSSTGAASNNPTTELDVTSKLPDLSTDKIVPAILSNDELEYNERQGRNAKNEEINTSESTTELTSTTLSDVSTTQQAESTTENHSDKSETQNKFHQESTVSPIPFNNSPVVPAISGKDFANGNTERHVRDTETEKSEMPIKVTFNTKELGLESSKNDTEVTTTETNDAIPVEEKSEDKDKEEHTFNNRKYTSAVPSKVELPHKPIEGKDSDKLRNVRGAEQMIETTTMLDETTTTEMTETTTLSSEDCVTTETGINQDQLSFTTEAPNVQDSLIGKGNSNLDPIPVYINNRQWDQRFNNRAFSNGQSQPGIQHPVVYSNEQSSQAPENTNPSTDKQ